jgi:hypothetical protein
VAGMSAGVRRLCLGYDVESYSGRGTRGEFATQRRLAEMLDSGFREAGLAEGDYELQEQGDGGLALLPSGGEVDDPRLIVDLIRSLENACTEVNDGLIPEAKARLRIGIGEGVTHRAAHGYVGPVIIEVCRLRDAQAVRLALAKSPGLLVIAATASLYTDILAHGYHGLAASAFRPIEFSLNGQARDAWLYTPGSACIAQPTSAESTSGQSAPRGASGSAGDDAPLQSLAALLETDPGTW